RTAYGLGVGVKVGVSVGVGVSVAVGVGVNVGVAVAVGAGVSTTKRATLGVTTKVGGGSFCKVHAVSSRQHNKTNLFMPKRAWADGQGAVPELDCACAGSRKLLRGDQTAN